MTNPDPAKSTQKQLRILVAEDNEINQKLIQRILQTAGYEVDMVDNGREAVEFASRNHYDFILMDLQMPLMDGYEATKLTGSNPGAKMEKCLGLGMNDCIGKPLSRDQLLSLIKRWTTTESVGSACGKAQKKVGEPIAENTSARQPIDLDRALNEFLGEKKVLNGILKEFTIKVRSQIRSIRQAFLSLDFTEIAKEAHSIKGGAANLTANKVAGMASALEKAAGLQQVDLVKNLAGELEDQFQLLENYLQCQLPLA
ncbi:MAG: response regulator [Deltaproteobacteria bacterium]|nr:response regulator [Deltaproteobacteria bacterium]